MTQPANKWKVWCLLLVLVASWPAFGQAPGGFRGGNGLKVGDGRLHLTFDFETRYDSAAGYFPPAGNTDPTVVSDKLSGEALMHIRPGLRLEIPGSTLALDLKGYADYVHYTGLFTPGSTNTSHLEAMADLNVAYNREAPIGVELGDHFQRSDQTRNAAVGAGVLSLYNELRLSVPVRPGGGAFEVTPQLAWGTELFKASGALPPVGCGGPTCDPAQVSSFDYNDLRAGVNARWRFLPKTAVLADAQFNVRSYVHGGTPGAMLLHAKAGLAGLVTPKIAVTATAGWGQDFGSAGGGSLIAQLEASYLMSQTATLKAGYARTLEPVASLGLFRDDRGYVEAQALLGGKLTVRGASSFDYLSFQGTRRDTLFKLDVGPQYQFERWLLLGAGYLLGIRTSSESGTGINYSRHEGYVRVTVTY
ncbi:hypothetical protein [Vitiosangium sp. GDMCC 1.1324]|uniref:hypothetical protein n=1 Tax=Vitiosangium sp. (strain GDMCC 1.1324) TaxID=2138576 RepID=UPI000D37503C|nr:hypothetical protein [Vitiosangium sp. GDMCC 1.1324]PTL79224.1 hypothetical protein DAT35_33990 [Vitiosangium sp. GDMCC 1.1324]